MLSAGICNFAHSAETRSYCLACPSLASTEMSCASRRNTLSVIGSDKSNPPDSRAPGGELQPARAQQPVCVCADAGGRAGGRAAGWVGGWVGGWVAGWLGGWVAGSVGEWNVSIIHCVKTTRARLVHAISCLS